MLKKVRVFAIVIIFFYSGIAYLLIHFNNYGQDEILGFIFAGILTTINIIATLFLLEKTIQKPAKQFLKSFMTSTLLRLFFLLLIFLLTMTMVTLNHFVFGIGFFILYFLFQMIEIYILHTNKQINK